MKNLIIIRNNNAVFTETNERGLFCIVAEPRKTEKTRTCFSVKQVYKNYKKGRTIILPTFFFTKKEISKMFENLNVSYCIPVRKDPFDKLVENVKWLRDCSITHDNIVIGKENCGYIKHLFSVDVYDADDCFNPVFIKTISCPNEKTALKISATLTCKYVGNRIIHEKQFVALDLPKYFKK